MLRPFRPEQAPAPSTSPYGPAATGPTVSEMIGLVETASRSLTEATRTIEERDAAIRRRDAELGDLAARRDDVTSELATMKRALGEARGRTAALERAMLESEEQVRFLESQLARATSQVERLRAAIGASFKSGAAPIEKEGASRTIEGAIARTRPVAFTPVALASAPASPPAFASGPATALPSFDHLRALLRTSKAA